MELWPSLQKISFLADIKLLMAILSSIIHLPDNVSLCQIVLAFVLADSRQGLRLT